MRDGGGVGVISGFVKSDGCGWICIQPRVGSGPLSPHCLSERLPVRSIICVKAAL